MWVLTSLTHHKAHYGWGQGQSSQPTECVYVYEPQHTLYGDDIQVGFHKQQT